jgi:hypothetical protein
VGAAVLVEVFEGDTGAGPGLDDGGDALARALVGDAGDGSGHPVIVLRATRSSFASEPLMLTVK